MKKRKCELCTKNKARRECKIKDKFICSLCCANLRDFNCDECQYFQAATQYNSSKRERPKKKPFIIEINEEIESAVDNALALVEKGKVENGRQILEELIKKHPENHMVNYGMGVVHAFKEQFDEAIKFFTKATDIFPYFVEAHFNKALAYKHKLDLKNTIRSLQKAVEVGDDRDDVVQQAKFLIKDFEDQTLRTERITLEKYFEAQEIFEKAHSYAENEEWSKAITEFQKCLEIKPMHPQSYGNIGLCFAQLGQKANALAALDKALEIDSKYEVAIVNRSVIETLEEGEKLTQEKLMSVDYYKDYPLKKKSYIRSIFDGIVH